MQNRAKGILVAAFVIGAGAIGIGAQSARAADLPVKAPVEAADPIDYGNLYFGTDVNTNGGLVGYGGLLYAPKGMDFSGFRLALFGLYGKYQYDNDDPTAPQTFKARFGSADILGGYSTVWDSGSATLAIGANYQNHDVSPFDPNNPVQGGLWGVKVQGDFYVNPTQQTLVSGIASYSTAFHTYYSILKFGYDFFGKEFFIGPEFVALGNERTDQQRVGIHITDIHVANRVSLSISGGWLHERGEPDGAYSTATIDFTF
jgi:Cellulose biosynthesis protein BcsS